ncbi:MULTISPECIES: DEAD/DEAH box helicase [unclassified Bradyrhizobium]|uniref:DEAD/DEAH box helicase n=1 Tax=unclassified Bradyrhizobium TaxID=2631580 RepID=UPI0024E08FB2|nr:MULTISPECIES: DEAD/DEAH box helicase [unclassified Bradyrhizobium]
MSFPFKKLNAIRPFFSHAAFQKAEHLQVDGGVVDLEISEDGHELAAEVQGSQSWPYDVEIALKSDKNGRVAVASRCSCPMGHGCKHVAAVLIEAIERFSDAEVDDIRSTKAAAQAKPRALVLPPKIVSWLDKIGKISRGDAYPPEVRQRLVYGVRAHAEPGEAPYPIVLIWSVRLRKDDSFSDQVSRVDNVRSGADRAPAFYRDSDIEILSRLSQGAYIDKGWAFRIGSAALMKRLIKTGRAYWHDMTGPLLRWGDTRAGRIEWQPVGLKGVGARLALDGALALHAEPPVYADEKLGIIGEVDTGIAASTAHLLLSAPVVPSALVGEVSRHLTQRLPALDPALLPARPTEVVQVEAKPVPVLRLMRGPYPSYGFRGHHISKLPLCVVRPGFRYGQIEIDASGKGAGVEAFHEGRIVRIKRSTADERKAAKRLTELGLVPLRRVQPYNHGSHAEDLTFEDEGRWLQFVHLDLDALREQGFDIRIDDDFPYRLAESSGLVDMEIEGSGIDWFEFGFKIDVDGQQHDLAELLVRLLASEDIVDALAAAGAETKHMYVPLPDGRHLALAAGRFLPVLLALQTMRLSGGGIDASGKIKLSRAQMLPLLAHDASAFALKGHDDLRRLADLVRQHRQDELTLPAGFTARLRPYQQQGVAWLDLLRQANLGGVLADDMGLGKTVQVLALLALEKARGALTAPVLIVAPTSLMTNWFNEAAKFVPDLKVLVFHGAARKQTVEQIPEYDVVLTTYPLIARDHELILARDWHMAILDEAQTIKNPNAATTRWLSAIKASHRFCLTGTPMENHLGELWSIMSFVNPGYLGDKTAFTRNWRTPIEKEGNQMRAAALTRRVKPFLLRRTKEEVASELPAKIDIVETVAIDGKQRDLYDSIRAAMAKKVRKALDERGLARSHIIVLEALLRLRQVCCDPQLLKLDDKVERPSAKLDRLMEMVEELLSEGRKIIIFSQFTSMLALIEARFEAADIDYELLTGDTRDRKRAIEAFQNGNSPVFLISLKAGGVGLNLTAADTVIIYDPWWNPAVEAQAIDRAHRIGQDKKVFVYRLVTAGTIEEKIGELKQRKQALADSLFDREGNIGKALTEEDIAALLS